MAGFLSLNRIHILGWISLCCRQFSSIHYMSAQSPPQVMTTGTASMHGQCPPRVTAVPRGRTCPAGRLAGAKPWTGLGDPPGDTLRMGRVSTTGRRSIEVFIGDDGLSCVSELSMSLSGRGVQQTARCHCTAGSWRPWRLQGWNKGHSPLHAACRATSVFLWSSYGALTNRNPGMRQCPRSRESTTLCRRRDDREKLTHSLKKRNCHWILWKSLWCVTVLSASWMSGNFRKK